MLPILLVTGFAEMRSVPGSCEVLHKPFRQEVLGRKVAEMMRRSILDGVSH